ncbi:MAG TPA: DUF4105 domain-containing protein [Gemmatimonadales bacterium]|nr:DUF4105 domain-containing protein [Gemmatimonadales bacterium]
MRWRGLTAGLLLVAAAVACPAAGWSQAPAPAAEPGARLTVYLMTMGQGARVWERFGHNAIYIHDPDSGTDQAYNYGLFDFAQDDFLLRFIQGRMWYWMAGYPAERYLQQYMRDNRSVWLQELEMPPAARLELQRFMQWNELPDNRFYFYDYYLDNCSTRVRDALDRFLGGRIRAQTEALPSGTTYRFHTERLTANDPAIYTGLVLALGAGADRPISVWEEMFLPLAMRERFRKITVPGPDGTPVPLVRSERTLFQSTEPEPRPAPPKWLPAYLVIGAVLGGGALLLGRAAGRRGGARLGLAVLAGGWGLVAGVAGLILAGLWGLTDHEMAYRNENLFQVSPLALLLPALVPFWLRQRSAEAAGRLLAGTAAVLAGLSLLGLALQALPGFDQVNGSIVALALPAHLGVAAALARAR